MKRHFKKLNNSVIEDLKQYIDSLNKTAGANRTMSAKSDIEVLDECCDLSCAIDFQKETHYYSRMQNKAAVPMSAAKYDTAQLEGITDFIKQPSFAENLFKIIDEKKLKDSRVYKKADIDRRLFSKIRSDADYHPSKSTTIKLCLALELGIAETEQLMETAGYCLSMSSTADLIIRYCIEKKIFNLVNVNEALDYFSQSAL